MGQDKIIAEDATAGDQFGISVAVDENTCVVGACLDNGYGSAYVFTKNGETWTQQDKLIADDAAAGDYFGGSVALSNNTCIVGASGDDSYTGSAYIFVRNGSNWSQQAKLVAADAAVGDCFGCAVAISGDTCIVGTWNAADPGCAYIFTRTGDTWSQQDKLTADDVASGDYFGCSVAIHGNTCIVGVYGAYVESAYIFVRKNDVWTQQDKLVTDQSVAGEYYYISVAVDNDTCAITAYGDDPGDVYIFTRKKSVWSRQAKLTSNDAAIGDYFGINMALNNHICIVGACGNNDNGEDSGSAYIFRRIGKVWRQQTKLTADDAAAGDQFGMGVAIGQNICAVGAWLDNSETGSAYLISIPDIFKMKYATTPRLCSQVVEDDVAYVYKINLLSNEI